MVRSVSDAPGSLAWFAAAALVAGCGGGGAPDCGALAAGLERDQCLHDALLALPAGELGEVEAIAGRIQDRILQQAAVSAWAAAHSGEVPREEGERLCGILEGRDQSYCMRRFSSPHLQRP